MAQPGITQWQQPFSTLPVNENSSIGRQRGNIYFRFHDARDAHCHLSWYQLPDGQKLGETIFADCAWPQLDTQLSQISLAQQQAVVRPIYFPDQSGTFSVSYTELRNTLAFDPANPTQLTVLGGEESYAFFRERVNADKSAFWRKKINASSSEIHFLDTKNQVRWTQQVGDYLRADLATFEWIEQSVADEQVWQLRGHYTRLHRRH